MTSAFDHISLPAGDFATGDSSDMFDFENYNNSFTSLNHSDSSHGQTVSPQEILMSAPGSAQMSLLDTPESDFMESPAMGSSIYNTTPLEDGSLDAGLDYEELKNLQPLFDHSAADQFSNMATHSNMDFSPVVKHSNLSTAESSPMVRQKSSPGRPPISANIHARKHSLNTGINKGSKSRKPLPQIEITEEDDNQTVKKKKNTAAARKSRQRRAEDMEYLQSENQRLRTMVEMLGGNPD